MGRAAALFAGYGGADTTAPVLSSPTGTQTGTTTASLSVATDTANGTMWWVVVADTDSAPSAAQIRAGHNVAGTAAVATNGPGGTTVTTSPFTASATGLTASSSYKVHFTQDDLSSNHSSVASSASFTEGSGSASAAYTNFATRCTSAGATLAGTDITNYQNLLDGLTTDGFFDGSGNTTYFDFLYIFAAPSATVGLLSLVNGTFNASVNNTPTFTQYRGYQTTSGTTNALLTGFNPSTAGGNFSQNSAHMGVWNRTNATDAGADMGSQNTNASGDLSLFCKFNGDSSCYARMNDSSTVSGGTAALTDARGHYIATRTSSTNTDKYQGQSGTMNALGSVTNTSAAMANVTVTIMSANSGTISATAHQYAAAHLGKKLTSTEANLIYQRLQTYMTAVGA